MNRIVSDPPELKEGYLAEPDQWNPQIAQWLAKEEGVELSEEVWAVVNLLREAYQTQGQPPSFLGLVIAYSKQQGIPRKAAKQALYRLFPDGPRAQAVRIAGLPKPKQGCV